MGFSKTHKHSKDYLIEFADTPNTAGWLRDLIIKIINNNRSLTEEEIESSTQQLIKGSDSILQFHDEKPTSSNNDIRFISLTHNSGVSALADNQTIKFSKNITLLYGKNGSGKSSYFKILNELVGGGNRTEIRPNIYSDTPNPIRVEVTYASAGTETIIVWDGRTRSISPLSSSCVFDSSYTNMFLQKRSAGSVIVQPYGLHLFTILTSAIEDIKKGNALVDVKDIPDLVPVLSVLAAVSLHTFESFLSVVQCGGCDVDVDVFRITNFDFSPFAVFPNATYIVVRLYVSEREF